MTDDRIAEMFARRMADRFGADPASWVMHLDFVREILPGADGWAPIDTAPKDGTWLYAFGDGDAIQSCPYIVSWNGKAWEEVYSQAVVFPTKWRPLPSPPSEGEGEGINVD